MAAAFLPDRAPTASQGRAGRGYFDMGKPHSRVAQRS